MDLPQALRVRLDEALAGVPLRELRAAAERLSMRYRGEKRAPGPHLDGDAAVLAYLATRLPATYAATRSALARIAEARPDFAPKTALDLGAGPGTGLWGLSDCWPAIERITLIEQSAAALAWGKRLAEGAPLSQAVWRLGDLLRASKPVDASDLVLLSYVLGEVAGGERERLIGQVWRLVRDTLLIVEPGTPDGWSRVVAARRRLLDLGAYILAPCPHAQDCPLVAPDWCHFAERVQRSRLHRELKGGELGWEDEKFIYLAASRHALSETRARIIARPRHGKGRVTLKLCNPDGHLAETIVSRRNGDLYKRASRVDWGDTV